MGERAGRRLHRGDHLVATPAQTPSWPTATTPVAYQHDMVAKTLYPRRCAVAVGGDVRPQSQPGIRSES